MGGRCRGTTPTLCLCGPLPSGKRISAAPIVPTSGLSQEDFAVCMGFLQEAAQSGDVLREFVILPIGRTPPDRARRCHHHVKLMGAGVSWCSGDHDSASGDSRAGRQRRRRGTTGEGTGPADTELPLVWNLGRAAITPSGAARLQRTTWPSTFADHQQNEGPLRVGRAFESGQLSIVPSLRVWWSGWLGAACPLSRVRGRRRPC